MNKQKLKRELERLNVDKRLYSLDGELKPDAIIMYNSYNQWEVFYLDERGGRNDKKIFDSEEKACNYVYKLFKESKEMEDKYL
jgi:hypothetical protein